MPKTGFDMEGALNRLGGDQELLSELVGFFLEDAPVLLDQIRDGFQNGSARLVERGAHSLKGLAANFGADSARDAAFRVEQLSRDAAAAEEEGREAPDTQAALADARKAFPQLEREIHALEQALASYQQTSGQ